MHALTQKVVRETLIDEAMPSALASVLGSLHTKLQNYDQDQPGTYAVGRRYARHAQAAAAQYTMSELKVLSDDELSVLAGVCHKSGEYYYTAGMYQDALELHEKSLAIMVQVHGEHHPHVAASYHNIASVYSKQGKLDKALELHEKSLAIWVQVHGEHHPDVSSLRFRISVLRLWPLILLVLIFLLAIAAYCLWRFPLLLYALVALVLWRGAGATVSVAFMACVFAGSSLWSPDATAGSPSSEINTPAVG